MYRKTQHNLCFEGMFFHEKGNFGDGMRLDLKFILIHLETISSSTELLNFSHQVTLSKPSLFHPFFCSSLPG